MTTTLAPARPRTQVPSTFGPNWFATVMGTGIVAIAAVTLPVQLPGARAAARLIWAAATVLLIVLTAATVAHWRQHPGAAREHLVNPVMSHFYGAFPMALMTVGTGALLVGRDLIGRRAAVDLDWALWSTGTALGLLTAVVVPFQAFTNHAYEAQSAFGGWLMPVVPPMVSASAGALLVPHAPAGQLRETLLLGCYLLFGMSLLASIVVITLIWSRLVHHKVGAAAAVPTLWIVLGPLGQSITAAGLMGNAATSVLPQPYAAGAAALALFYGLATYGFALLWLTLAAAMTIRTARERLPFSLTWWSFTFPVGTLVTATSGLAIRTGLDVFDVAAVGLFVLLVTAWATVAVRTARGTAHGRLLRCATP